MTKKCKPRDLIIIGDATEVLRVLPNNFVDCVVTSPPYWRLRDYGVDGQIGLESTLNEYIGKLVQVFREIRRVMKDKATLWLNMGDTYVSTTSGYGERGGNIEPNRKRHTTCKPQKISIPIGLKPKDLMGMPWRIAFALQADGWWLRSDIIWKKWNPMPESVTDRPTKSHEYLFLMSKKAKYFYDADAIKEKALEAERENRNKRTVWTIPIQPFPEAHFATFPEKLVEPCILAGCPKNGIVLDPFIGSGTVALVAKKLGRDFIGIELNPEYIKIIRKRLFKAVGLKARAIDFNKWKSRKKIKEGESKNATKKE